MPNGKTPKRLLYSLLYYHRVSRNRWNYKYHQADGVTDKLFAE